MPVVYITRKARFSASHRLFDPNYSDQKNEAVFGKCSNPNGHGHNYSMEVCVTGEPDPKTGFLIDLKILSAVIQEHFISKVDHKNLNLDVPFLQGVIPTTENVVIAAWNQIEPHINGAKLYSIRLFETEKNFVEYRGDNR